VYVCAEVEVSDVEQVLGSLSAEAVTVLVTANNSNAGQFVFAAVCLSVCRVGMCFVS